MNSLNMDKIKTWPHLVIIGVVCAAFGVGAVALWRQYESSTKAETLPSAARIERVDGQAGLNHSLGGNGTKAEWVEVTPNTPISVGDRVYTRGNSRSEIAFTGRNFATLDGNTSLDVLDLANDRTQLALREGSAIFDVGSLPSDGLFEVATPCGAVDLQQPGVYDIAIDDNGNAVGTVLSGLAQVVGQGGSGQIEKGETLTVSCQGASGNVLSRIEPNAAGTLLDNYYRYRYPRHYDGRYRNYYTYLEDPYYYDPYRRYTSYQYVSDYIPGVEDLDDYGDWQYVSDYGYCWHPRVDYGWTPYQTGYWINDYPYGLTWISNEPWGYAPYHYGRWTYVSNQWLWVPDGVRTTPVYSPALVAFIPLAQTGAVGWVPLAPGDPYVPRYYEPDWQPRYLTRTPVIQERVINLNVPGAVTVVNVRDFDRVIDPRIVARVDPQQFAHVRPVLDPFVVREFRDVALQTRGPLRRIDVPPAVAQRIHQPVVASTTPMVPFRRDLAQALRVQPVPERMRDQRLKFRDNRQGANGIGQPPSGQQQSNNMAAEQVRERQMAGLAREAARGNRAARQQMQELQRQQRQEQQQQRAQMAAQQRAQRLATQQAQGERVANSREQRRLVSPPPQAAPRDRARILGPPVRDRAKPPQEQRPPAVQQPRQIQQAQPQSRPQAQQPQVQMRQQALPKAQEQQGERHAKAEASSKPQPPGKRQP